MAKKNYVALRLNLGPGTRDTLRAVGNLGKDAANALRAAALVISRRIATSAAASGREEGSQAGLVATTVRPAKDRVPVVVAGGTKRLGRNKKPAFKLLFGSEFGSDAYEQFKPHLGKGSYWFFRTIEEQESEIAAEWNKAADEVIRKFDSS